MTQSAGGPPALPIPDETSPTGPDEPGPDKAGPDNAGPDEAGPDEAGPDEAGPDEAGPIELTSAQITPDHAGPEPRRPPVTRMPATRDESGAKDVPRPQRPDSEMSPATADDVVGAAPSGQAAADLDPLLADRPARPETGALPSWPHPEKPARPTRTSYLRSPLEDLAVPAPRSVRLSLWAWIASCIPAALAIILTLTRLTEVRGHLRATALTETPDLTAASLVRIVNVTIWVAVAALAVPIIVEIVLAAVMVNRGNWARFVLPPVGLLAIPAAVIAIDALSDETAVTNHSNMIIGISVQAALMLTATLLMFVPSAAAWFRTRPRKAPHRTDRG